MNTFVRNRVEEARERVRRACAPLGHVIEYATFGSQTHLKAQEAQRELDWALEQLDIVLKEFDNAGIKGSPKPQEILKHPKRGIKP